jgi:hypothetical protein
MDCLLDVHNLSDADVCGNAAETMRLLKWRLTFGSLAKAHVATLAVSVRLHSETACLSVFILRLTRPSAGFDDYYAGTPQ